MLLQMNRDASDFPHAVTRSADGGGRNRFCEMRESATEKTRKRSTGVFPSTACRALAASDTGSRSRTHHAPDGASQRTQRTTADHGRTPCVDREQAERARRPQQAAFYTRENGNETASLPAIRRQFGTNNSLTARHVSRVERTRSRLDRHREGARRSTTCTRQGADRSANPDVPSAMLTRSRSRREGGRSSRSSAPRNGADALSTSAAGCKSQHRSTQIADLYLPVRINGDVAVLQWHHERCWPPRTRHPAQCSTTVHSSAHGVLRPYIEHLLLADWNVIVEEAASRASRSPKARIGDGTRLVVAWAMGLRSTGRVSSSRVRQLVAA